MLDKHRLFTIIPVSNLRKIFHKTSDLLCIDSSLLKKYTNWSCSLKFIRGRYYSFFAWVNHYCSFIELCYNMIFLIHCPRWFNQIRCPKNVAAVCSIRSHGHFKRIHIIIPRLFSVWDTAVVSEIVLITFHVCY